MQRQCFTGADLIYGDDLALLQGQALLVEEGRITGIGEPQPDAEIIDMSGRLLCPMFIDSHTHIGDTGAKDLGIGMTLEESVVPPNGLKHRYLAGLGREEHITTMRHGMLEMLQSGVIAFADFREQGAAGTEALRAAADGLPIRAIILGRINENISLTQALDEAAELLAAADGLGIRDVNAHDTAILQRLRDDYPERLFAVHASEGRQAQEKSLEATGSGQVERALEWGVDILIHLVHATEREIRLAAERGAAAVSCPRTNAILGDGFADLFAWKQAGLHFGLGSDNMMFSSPDLLREMDFAARVARGLHENPTVVDTHTILNAATIEGARMLRLDGDLGSLAPGKEANFIVFDLSSLNLCYTHDLLSAIIHRAGQKDIESVFIRGKHLDTYLEGR